MAKKTLPKTVNRARRASQKPDPPPAPTTHTISVSGECGCPKSCTIRLPLPTRLHAMEMALYCHECKQVFKLKEETT